MKLCEFDTTVAAKPEHVFRAVNDPRTRLSWLPEVHHVEPSAPGQRGSLYRASVGVWPLDVDVHECVTDWRENERVTCEGLSDLGRFKTTVSLEPASHGTRVRFRVDYRPRGGRMGELVTQLLRPLLRRAAGKLVESRVKSALEDAATAA